MPQQAQPSPSPKPKKKIQGAARRQRRRADGRDRSRRQTAGPAWGPNDKHRCSTSDHARRRAAEGHRRRRLHLRSRLPGMLFGRILRCPHAHARVTKLDTDAAAKIPGVKAIVPAPLTEAAFAGAPSPRSPRSRPRSQATRCARSKSSTKCCPTSSTPPHAMQARTRRRSSPNENNARRQKAKNGDPAKVDAAFATADAVVEAEYITPSVHHAAWKRTASSSIIAAATRATVYASTQGTFTIPADAARELGLDQSEVTSIVEHMGGGFGSKFGIGIGRHVCLPACRKKRRRR